jgi:DNA-binding beta-propeller fold protein YncE
VGEHVLTATPFAATQGQGAVGSSVTIRFSVIDDVRQINVAATPDGTNALHVHWDGLSSAVGTVARYRITAVPGTFSGATRTVEVGASVRSATIDGLDSFKMYTVTIRALDARGVEIGTGRITPMTAPMDTQRRYLYSVNLPIDRRGFRNLTPRIDVFDVAAGHKFVKSIPLPAGIFNARGLAVNASTDRLYVSFFNTDDDRSQPGGLICLDLNTGQVLWVKRYDASLVPAPDRFALTPDGEKIYLPTGEGSAENTSWVVIDADTGEPTGKRIYHVAKPHNTIVSIDGRLAFLEGQEQGEESADVRHTVGVVDTATDKVIRRIGPFRDVVRPFTVSGDARFMFAAVNNFVGFQVASIESGKVLYTVPVPGVTQPTTITPETPCHGIAITPDEKLLFLNDRVSGGVQVFDISGVRNGKAPRYLKFILTRKQGRDLGGNIVPAGSDDPADMPGWLAVSYDGRYVYPESGEIIDTQTLKTIGIMTNGTGLYEHSKFMVEVVFNHGKAVRVGDQFGVGRVR